MKPILYCYIIYSTDVRNTPAYKRKAWVVAWNEAWQIQGLVNRGAWRTRSVVLFLSTNSTMPRDLTCPFCGEVSKSRKKSRKHGISCASALTARDDMPWVRSTTHRLRSYECSPLKRKRVTSTNAHPSGIPGLIKSNQSMHYYVCPSSFNCK